MVINGKTLLVVAGGIHWEKYLLGRVDYGVHFTEILDPTSDQGWILGPKLYHMDRPINLWDVTMVTSPDEQGVIIFGGRMSKKYNLQGMFEMRSIGTTLEEFKFEWQGLDFDLPRFCSDQIDTLNRLAFSIPGDFTNKEQ